MTDQAREAFDLHTWAKGVAREAGFSPLDIEFARCVGAVMRAYSAGLSAGREQQWISVEDRLPEKFEQVFIHMKPVPEGPDWYPRTNVGLAWQKRGIWFGSFVDPMTGKVENGEFPDDLITHWQPLPLGPVGATQPEVK